MCSADPHAFATTGQEETEVRLRLYHKLPVVRRRLSFCRAARHALRRTHQMSVVRRKRCLMLLWACRVIDFVDLRGTLLMSEGAGRNAAKLQNVATTVTAQRMVRVKDPPRHKVDEN